MIELLFNLLNPHPKAPTHASTLKCLLIKEHTPTLPPFIVFTFGLTVESTKKLEGASLGCVKAP